MDAEFINSNWFGIAIGILAGILTNWLFVDRRAPKLTWALTSSDPLTQLFTGPWDKPVGLTVNGKTEANAHLVVIRIWNAGSDPIAIYIDHICITLRRAHLDQPEPAILAVLTSSPSKAPEIIKQPDNKKVVLDHLPLNEHDWYEVQLIVRQQVNLIREDQIRVTGNYVGNKPKIPGEIPRSPQDRDHLWNLILGIGLVFTALFLLLTIVFGSEKIPILLQLIIGIQSWLAVAAILIPNPLRRMIFEQP